LLNNFTTIDSTPGASGSGQFARKRLTHLYELRAQDHLCESGRRNQNSEGTSRVTGADRSSVSSALDPARIAVVGHRTR